MYYPILNVISFKTRLGGDETLISDVPSFAEMLQRSSLDWKYKTVPQNDSCLAFENNQCYISFLIWIS